MSIEEGIKKVYSGGSHVVILGAGASIASCTRNVELSMKQLPSMNNFIEIVGLRDIISSLPSEYQSLNNFESLYSSLYANDPNSDVLREIETSVVAYFQDMKLPEEPTIYDYLVMSLRDKDLIATFNWDPFLFQAYCRNYDVGSNPKICFLHGNVAIGYSIKDKIAGPAGNFHPESKCLFEPTKLLYPIAHKDYNSDDFISLQWNILNDFLSADSTKRVTIFGYGAPETDVEAVNLLSSAWGSFDERNMEQFEVIDVQSKDLLLTRWNKFINSHHYDIVSNYFESILSQYPRRTGERFFHQFMPNSPSEAFQEPNPVPDNFKTLDEMWKWFNPLIEAEKI